MPGANAPFKNGKIVCIFVVVPSGYINSIGKRLGKPSIDVSSLILLKIYYVLLFFNFSDDY